MDYVAPGASPTLMELSRAFEEVHDALVKEQEVGSMIGEALCDLSQQELSLGKGERQRLETQVFFEERRRLRNQQLLHNDAEDILLDRLKNLLNEHRFLLRRCLEDVAVEEESACSQSTHDAKVSLCLQ